MRHCFLLGPRLPASWLVEDRCLFVMRVLKHGGGTSTGSSHGPLLWRQRHCVGSANLISHPVGALLPQAQGRRDKTQQFVHVLIANPPAERDNTRWRGLEVTLESMTAAIRGTQQSADSVRVQRRYNIPLVVSISRCIILIRIFDHILYVAESMFTADIKDNNNTSRMYVIT